MVSENRMTVGLVSLSTLYELMFDLIVVMLIHVHLPNELKYQRFDVQLTQRFLQDIKRFRI